jgi:glycosyltransferase involved in cell wall biosynthesis
MKKERILIDCQILQGKSRNRGFGNYAYRILNDLLTTEEFEIEILLSSNGLPRNSLEIIKFARDNSIEIYTFNAPVLVPFEYSQHKIFEAEKSYQIAIEKISPEYLFVLAPMALLHEQIICLDFKSKNIKKIGIYYDRIAVDIIEAKNHLNLTELDLIKKFVELPKFDLLFAISTQSKSELTSICPNNKVITHRLKIEPIQKYLSGSGILSIVNMGIHKKLPELVESYEAYRISSPNIRTLTVTGVPFTKRMLKTKSHVLENVKFHGKVSIKKLVRLYSESLFVITPSMREGLGLPVIEAIERGCIPIYSSSIPAAEFLENNLFEFDPNVVGSLADTLNKIESMNAINPLKVNSIIQESILEYNSKFESIALRIRNFSFE